MARANVYNEYKTKEKSHKKLWVLTSVLAVVVIAVVVVLVLWGLGFFNNDSKTTYFADTKYDDYKINYSQLSSKLKATENTFLFVYDNDAYDDLKEADRQDIETRIDRLIASIDKANEEANADRFSFYLLDTTVNSNDQILNNADYGSFSFTPQLMYLYNGKYYASLEDACEDVPNLDAQISDDFKEITFTNNSVNNLILNLNQANDLVNNM